MLDSYQFTQPSGWTCSKMTDHSSKREKISRPFYELPAHIKPCSKIIQETRMQLKYSRKLGSNMEVPYGNGTNFGDGGMGNFSSGQNGDSYTGHVVELPNIHSESGGGGRFGSGGIKPVETKRPFTPRDTVSLWGVSARKRPPSAIT